MRTSRRNRAIALMAAAAIAIAACASRAIAEDAEARAASNKIVAAAESMIKRAGASDPVNTDSIHAAIARLQAAAKIDPRNDSAYVDLGFCYGLLRDVPTAIDMYTKAARINPSGANFLELSDVYLRTGDSESALMAANAGLDKEPKSARLYNAKGVALNDLARFGEAAEAFEKAVKLDPDLTVARTNLNALNSGSSGRGSVMRHSRGN
ncbi:MAG: tetratricopeptide repeat protein [Candidatus Binataceae bacterium]